MAERHQVKAGDHLVRQVLRKDLKMSFRKVKALSWTENSAKSKILRQQFALSFLDIDYEKKVIMHVDQTWLGMSDFRRCKWRQHRHTNSVRKLVIQPRVSMIVGLDTKGEVFLTLSQANTNGDNMKLFFSELIRKLDVLRPGWKKNHVLLLDNASWHRSKKVQKYFEDHQLPIMYTGSYSYDAGK